VLGSVPAEAQGQASGANSAIRELGGVLGVAVLAAVFAHVGGDQSGEAVTHGGSPARRGGAAVRLPRPDAVVGEQPPAAPLRRAAAARRRRARGSPQRASRPAPARPPPPGALREGTPPGGPRTGRGPAYAVIAPNTPRTCVSVSPSQPCGPAV